MDVGVNFSYDIQGVGVYFNFYVDIDLFVFGLVEEVVMLCWLMMNGVVMNCFFGIGNVLVVVLGVMLWYLLGGNEMVLLEYDLFVFISYYIGVVLVLVYGCLFGGVVNSLLVQQFGIVNQWFELLVFIWYLQWWVGVRLVC